MGKLFSHQIDRNDEVKKLFLISSVKTEVF